MFTILICAARSFLVTFNLFKESTNTTRAMRIITKTMVLNIENKVSKSLNPQDQSAINERNTNMKTFVFFYFTFYGLDVFIGYSSFCSVHFIRSVHLTKASQCLFIDLVKLESIEILLLFPIL